MMMTTIVMMMTTIVMIRRYIMNNSVKWFAICLVLGLALFTMCTRDASAQETPATAATSFEPQGSGGVPRQFGEGAFLNDVERVYTTPRPAYFWYFFCGRDEDNRWVCHWDKVPTRERSQ